MLSWQRSIAIVAPHFKPLAGCDGGGSSAGAGVAVGESGDDGGSEPLDASSDPVDSACKQPTPPQPSETTNYHRGAVLHMLMLSVLEPRLRHHSERVRACIAVWLDEHEAAMAQQFDAVLRFANVILLLLPFPPSPLNLSVASAPASASVPFPSATGSSSGIGGIGDSGADGFSNVDDPLTETVYALGESHILPLAWCHIQMPDDGNAWAGAGAGAGAGAAAAAAAKAASNSNGRKRWLRIVPRLCVGLKAFHFGAEVVARERGILLEHMASIPPRSSVLVVAGEIDCRHNGQVFHSPLFPSRKRRYATTVAGVFATVRMYIQGLVAFAAGPCDPKRVLIMPVRPPPPLDPSLNFRGIIPIWNAVLRSELKKAGARVECFGSSGAGSVIGDEAGVSSAGAGAGAGVGVGGKPAGKIIYVDLYADLCADAGRAEEVEADVDSIVAGAAGQSEKKLVALLETKMKTLHACDAIVLRPEFELGDQAHLNRTYLHLPVAAIARLL